MVPAMRTRARIARAMMAVLAVVGVVATTVRAENPLALHLLTVVEKSGDAVIRLMGYDLDGNDLTMTVQSLPETGTLTQLSNVFSDYGYEPKQGVAVAAGDEVTGSLHRLYYYRPTNDAAMYGKWGTFTYTVNDGDTDSWAGMVTLVPSSGILVGSNFLVDNDDWTISGNKVASSATHDATSRGTLMNHFVLGSDNKINTDSDGQDTSLWYFDAPSDFHGHHGIAYGGTLEFALTAFSGDFSDGNRNDDLNLVYLECEACQNNAFVTLAFPLSSVSGGFDGSTTQFSIDLTETSGWLEDPENSLVSWSAPSKCTFIEVLSNLSGVRIAGDFTNWYESIGLDSVVFRNLKAQIPICAQGRPDASVCTC